MSSKSKSRGPDSKRMLSSHRVYYGGDLPVSNNTSSEQKFVSKFIAEQKQQRKI